MREDGVGRLRVALERARAGVAAGVGLAGVEVVGEEGREDMGHQGEEVGTPDEYGGCTVRAVLGWASGMDQGHHTASLDDGDNPEGEASCVEGAGGTLACSP